MLRAKIRAGWFRASPLLVACLIGTVVFAGSAPIYAAFIAGIGVTWLATCVAGSRVISARYARACRVYTEPVTVTLEKDGLRTETQHGGAVIRKSLIARTRAWPTAFVAEMANGQTALVLPRVHLSPQEVAVLEGWANERARVRGPRL
jgi:hypothetical protein